MSSGFRGVLLECLESMFQLFDMAFLAFPECPLTMIRISIRVGEGVGLELLRCAILFFSSLSGCQVSVICEMKAVIRTMAYPLSRCQFLLLATAPGSLLRVMLNGCVAPYRRWYILVAGLRFKIVKA